MEYPPELIHIALIRSKAEKSKNELEKFILQQNIIQSLLTRLIIQLCNVPDRDFQEWVETRVPLGSLIDIYKICAVVDGKERSLIKSLKEYNKKRRSLVHKIFDETSHQEFETKVKTANEIGIEIIRRLDQLIYKVVVDSFGVRKSFRRPKKQSQNV